MNLMFKKNYRFTDDNQFSYRANTYNQTQDNRKRPQRDFDLNDQSFVSGATFTKTEKPMVYEAEDYYKLQAALTKKLQTIIDNIQISQEKNKLKDKQIQILAQSIDKLIQKISVLQAKISAKQKRLNKISLKCHDKTSQVGKQQEKIRKQATVLNEEASKCQSLEKDINLLQEKYNNAAKELQHCKQIYKNMDAVEQENKNLRIQLNQLQNEQKMASYMQNNQRLECQQLQDKLEELKKIYKERALMNKRNMAKLNKLKKQINTTQDGHSHLNKKIEQIRRLQLQLGELNQQLLLSNQDISQFDFKIRKKQKAVAELKQKMRVGKYQPLSIKRQNKVIQSEEQPEKTESNSLKTSKKNSISKNNQELSVNSRKDQSPHIRNRSNLTPTFPSNQLQPNLGSQELKSVEEAPSEAFKNIEKLINRFQQIKNKQKFKNY